jgi:G3E family GTPase
MKHILETKHQEKGKPFKCAVIVNDMAELNVDKALIDQSAILQSDTVIAMQNGCVCCTLSDDLANQIISLAQQDKYDYMIIEASGISEPSQIAQLFDDCQDDHDHAAHGDNVLLSDVVRCLLMLECLLKTIQST